MGRSRDEGSTHILEAVVVASIMVSAVAFVVTSETPGPQSAYKSVATALDRQTSDFVDGRFGWTLEPGGCVADSRGEQWLLDAASQRRSSFRDDVNRSFASGIDANLLLKNGYGSIWLHKEFDNPAIASRTHTFEPNWSAAYVLPVLGIASGVEQVEINSAAVIRGELAMLKGEGVEIVVTFDNGKQERIYAPTALLGGSLAERTFAQNLTLTLPGSTIRKMTVSLAADEVAAPPAKSSTRLSLMTSPGPKATGATIPAGTTLTVRLPPQWSDATAPAETLAQWDATTSGTVATGLVMDFTLRAASDRNETVLIDAYAPTLPAHAYDVISADMAQGGLAHAEFVVQYPGGVDKGLPISIHPSVPYPVQAGTDTIFGVAIANGGADVKVRQVDLMVPGGFDMRHNDGRGAALFADVQPSRVNDTGLEGVWKRVNERHIQWKGSMPITGGKARDILVSARMTSDTTQTTAIEPVWSSQVKTELAHENGFTSAATGWGATPGFVRNLVRPDSLSTPESDGYPFVVPQTGSLAYSIDATVASPRGTLEGSAGYTIVPGTSDLASVQNAVGNASTRVSDRIVPLGSLVHVDHDVSSLLTTLADQGAGDITIQVDLYTPASQACGPTSTWVREAATLPLARIPSMSIFDESGLGAPGVYLAAEDLNAYKVGTLGTTAWSTLHASQPTKVATANIPGLGASVFTGTSVGGLARIDPALAGVVSWTARQAASASIPSDPNIRGLAIDATNGKVAAWSEHILDVRDAATGALVAERDAGLAGETYIDVAWDLDGTMLALTTQGLHRLDPALSTTAVFPATDAVGFALTPTGALLAQVSSAVVLDRDLVAVGGPIGLGGTVELVSSGDATGDGIEDLVVALGSLSVKIVSGATGSLDASYTVELSNWNSVGVGVPTLGPIWWRDDSIWMEMEPPVTRECEQTSLGESWRTAEVCVVLSDPNRYAPLPVLLEAAEGRVAFSFRLGSVAKTVAWNEQGTVVLDKQHLPTLIPTSLAIGRWTLGLPAIAIATSDGNVALYGGPAGSLSWEATPTSSTGTFAFTLRVPQGGFFGTNVLLTRVRWEDPLIGPQEVVLPEWFQVVAPDGRPVLHPVYTVVALIQAADMPMVPARP